MTKKIAGKFKNKKRIKPRVKITPLQTHIRAFKKDKAKLKRYMKKNNIKSETQAINKLFKIIK